MAITRATHANPIAIAHEGMTAYALLSMIFAIMTPLFPTVTDR